MHVTKVIEVARRNSVANFSFVQLLAQRVFISIFLEIQEIDNLLVF